MLILFLAVSAGMISPSKGSYVSAFYVLGDSSVDCGGNTLFYPFLHGDLSLHPCSGGADKTLVPHFLAEKMGIQNTPPFYAQNGSIASLLRGMNFGSAEATILNFGGRKFQSLNQQLRQVLETFQLVQLHLAEESAREFMESSITYLSFGKDDYIEFFLRTSSGITHKFTGQEFARVLVDQMIDAVISLYNANARKIICMGILPLGCTPRIRWERVNSTSSGGERNICAEEVNELILEYNSMLEGRIFDLKAELPDAKIVFCNTYHGILEVITSPQRHGFEDVETACCGLGQGGMLIGCLSTEMACKEESAHVWWDLYNPTQAVNRLLAESAWSGQELSSICRPVNIQELVSISFSR
ncbi:GDSL esterase/lipase At1g71250-like [Eucalyptus grandis]|uniref:GDSL esterase/lipase At1g71250-like n=1 Tax=Eucalyptus grandis TaxID=71139 RepID=UPI00192EF4AA|nr:GDSL esterase/lipase At1g71250-like [Eucalyptus grandis]